MSKNKRKNRKELPDMGEDVVKSATKHPEDAIDESPIVYQKSKLTRLLNINKRPLTDKQQEFLKLALAKSTKMIFVSGPAGSSKTFIAILAGLMLMNEKKLSDIIYVRSAVESSEKSLGFLPGEMKDKLSPYLQPLEEKLMELLPKHDIAMLKKEERLEPMPCGFMRGLNWNAKFILADEAQNMTQKELTTLITRIGEFSKVFVCGDPMQSDLPPGKSGFMRMYDHFNDEESRANGIYTFEFTDEDIVRSALVKYIIGKLKNFT
jgi:phosphate starvation-inducible PhoH-like protein